jgi:membrane protein YqaA with SNARE-associated domain
MIRAFVHFFLSLPGVFVLGFLDGAFFFTLPLGIDAAVVTLAGRRAAYVWLTPLLATGGSLLGAALTYWTGRKIGEAGLAHFASKQWLTRVERRLKGSAMTLAALDLMPPPFPFSVFVLGAGAAKVNRRKFFVTLACCRLLRFGVEALLGFRYGRYALKWLESDTVQGVVSAVVLLAVVFSAVSLARLRYRRAQPKAASRADRLQMKPRTQQ